MTPANPTPEPDGQETPNFYALNSGGHGDAVAKIKELFAERDEARRRLEEVEKERDDWQKESDANARFIADLVRDGITRDSFTALRNSADGMAEWIESQPHAEDCLLHVRAMPDHLWCHVKCTCARAKAAAYSALIAEGVGK